MHAPSRLRGFTLIELLVVIAIIGILAAIIIPTVGAVRKSAYKAKTKTQLTQWVSALERFRQEYGYYPRLTATLPTADVSYNLGTDPGARDNFIKILSARNPDGSAYTLPTAVNDLLRQNKRLIQFYEFGQGEIASGGALLDGFGNNHVVLLVDGDNDGIINVALPSVVSAAGVTLTPPPLVAPGLRAKIAFYSPGAGEQQSDIIYTWQ